MFCVYRSGLPHRFYHTGYSGRSQWPDPTSSQFIFYRKEILSINPVSVNDKRKFIIDAMPQINNIWLEPVVAPDVYGSIFTTVYKTIVQLPKDHDPEIRNVPDQGEFENEPANIEALKAEVKGKLIASRNLCEDFEDVTVLKPEFIEITTGILIEQDAAPEEVLAGICLRLEAMVTPTVKYATEKDLKDGGFQPKRSTRGRALQKVLLPTMNYKI